jgi:hypothetical protein
MSTTAFVLMNCDLVAVPLQVAAVGVVTVYCGKQRATQLLSGFDGEPRRDRSSTTGFMSVARRPGTSSGAHTRA